MAQPLPTIEPFTPTQRLVRRAVAVVDDFHDRCINSSEFVAGNFLLWGAFFLCAPILLALGTATAAWFLPQAVPFLVVALIVSLPVAGAIYWYFKKQRGLTQIGRLNMVQYSMIEAMAMTEPTWREQIIAWAIEFEHFDDRHYRAVQRAWVSSKAMLPQSYSMFVGRSALDLFDREPRERLECYERSRNLRAQLDMYKAPLENTERAHDKRKM